MLWAPRLNLNKCRRCGSDERPHRSGGYCNRCFQYLKYHRQLTRYEREVKILEGVREVDWAYIAGIMDGEGTVTAEPPGRDIHGRAKAGRPRLIVNMTDEAIIRWLHETLGGTRFSRPPGAPTRKPVHGWQLNGVKVVIVLLRLLPYLRVKRTQANLVVQFIRVKQEGGRNPAQGYVEQMHAIKAQLLILNRRGVAPREEEV